jgi:ureidoacrylate peracid hydrolase
VIADPALILVDLQRDFCDPEGAHGGDAEMAGEGRPADAVSAASTFLERYRASGRTPILIRTTHDDATTSSLWKRKYDDRPTPCRPGTDGAEFASGLGVDADDVVVTKHRYSAFHDTPLDVILRSNDVSEVLIGGVATNVCVESTVRGAFDREYQVTLLEDCTGSTEDALREATLQNVADHFGTVRQSGDVELDPLSEPDPRSEPAGSVDR